MRKFTGEQQITSGHFFGLHGVMVYMATAGERQRNKGKANARLHCVFENGTESDMLLRSLATELYKDENGRRVLNLDKDGRRHTPREWIIAPMSTIETAIQLLINGGIVNPGWTWMVWLGCIA